MAQAAGPLPVYAPWSVTGSTGTDTFGRPTASATLGNITYTASGADTLHATLGLARKLVEAGFDLDALLTVDGASLSLRQAV
jgi:hypothetical protein